MAAPGAAARGLSAAELAAACGELMAFVGAVVLDVAPLTTPPGADDLLLVLDPGDGRPKLRLHVAPGGPRARLTLTSRRFRGEDLARGPGRDLLQRHLAGATLTHVGAADGERRGAFTFRSDAGDRRLVVELFGARGFWALLDAEGRLLVMSRPIETAVRTLRLGEPYQPPPAPRPGTATAPEAAEPPRFAAPVLAAIDEHFRPRDEQDGRQQDLEALQRAAARALARAQAKVDGLERQLADVGRADGLRREADMMLAYAHTVRRGAATMTFPDPDTGEPRTVALDPSRPVVVQAQGLYEKARRLDDSRAINTARLQAAAAERDALAPLVARLAALAPDDGALAEQLGPLRAELQRCHALPRPPAARAVAKAPQRAAAGENFRRFVSAEGYPIWVGRNNEQNDRLTLRVANGNDLWLHVGGGRPGSHVIVRLPKEKTASLETLLDAATLAVHFSKARGERRIDVVYTHKKHVRKPKGLPAGAVVPSQTKTITVVLDEERLRRLLDSAGGDAD